jgi:MFS family permease
MLTVVLGPIVSQAADYWGRKWFLVILTSLGAVGSLVVAQSSNMSMVIAGFSITGAALGAQPLLHTVASEVLPRRWRAWGQSAVMIANAWSLITGLVVGGALTRHGNPNGFRNYSYISLALFALAAILCGVSYQPLPSDLQLTLSTKEKLGRLDWIGYALLSSSLVLFCIGLSWSQNPYPWSDPHVSATFAVGLALGVGLILYESIFKKDGMFHHGLFKTNRNFTIALICVFAEGIAFFAANGYVAFQVSVLYETDSLIVGVRFAIAFIATTFAALCTGLYCAITKKVRGATFVAFVIFTVFYICMATTNKDSSREVWGYPILMGWALGMTLITLITVAQLSTPPELISIASGLIISMRSLGGTIGIAICRIPCPSLIQRIKFFDSELLTLFSIQITPSSYPQPTI